VDLAVAKAATTVAVGEASAGAKAAGKVLNITATIIPDSSLEKSIGGVVVTAMNGRIRCSNTLEDRLNLVLHDLTPVIRDLLFPSAKAAEKAKPAVYFPHKVTHAPSTTSHAPPPPAVVVKAAPTPQTVSSAPVASPEVVVPTAVVPPPVANPPPPSGGSSGGADPFAF